MAATPSAVCTRMAPAVSTRVATATDAPTRHEPDQNGHRPWMGGWASGVTEAWQTQRMMGQPRAHPEVVRIRAQPGGGKARANEHCRHASVHRIRGPLCSERSLPGSGHRDRGPAYYRL
jgi:hypothetical protein